MSNPKHGSRRSEAAMKMYVRTRRNRDERSNVIECCRAGIPLNLEHEDLTGTIVIRVVETLSR